MKYQDQLTKIWINHILPIKKPSAFQFNDFENCYFIIELNLNMKVTHGWLKHPLVTLQGWLTTSGHKTDIRDLLKIHLFKSFFIHWMINYLCASLSNGRIPTRWWTSGLTLGELILEVLPHFTTPSSHCVSSSPVTWGKYQRILFANLTDHFAVQLLDFIYLQWVVSIPSKALKIS